MRKFISRFYNYVTYIKSKYDFAIPSRQYAMKVSTDVWSKRISVGYVLSFLPSFLILKAVSKQSSKEKLQNVIQEADVLFNDGQFDQLYDILSPHQSSDDPELLWRLARALYEKSRYLEKDKKLAMLEEALSLVDKALEINDECWAAHKWRSILLDYVWRYKSTKGRIINSFEIKKHIQRAIELNPNDSTSYYILGEWCFTFADMPWYQRKVAAAIFASPPTSSYDEALECFMKGEKMNPLFYSMNLLMIGKCLLKMNRKEEAVTFLQKVKEYPRKTADDEQAFVEAVKLLKELNIDS